MGKLLSAPLWLRILIGMVLGVLLGLSVRDGGILAPLVNHESFVSGLKLVGDAFVRLIRMLSVPLVFVSVAAAVVSISDLSKLGSSGARVAALYIPSGILAATLGYVLATLIAPGTGADVSGIAVAMPEAKPPPTLQDIVWQFIPANPIKALADGEMLSIIVFALLFGVGVLGAGHQGRPIAEALESASAALIKLVGYIMELAPIGAFALIAWAVAMLGLDALVRLAALVGTVYLGCIIYIVVVYGGFLKFVLNLPVIPFIKGFGEAMAVAYATSSSSATLPVTMRLMTEKLGISKRMTSFVASMGATVNMDGTSMYIVIVTVFGAQLFGVEMNTATVIGVIFAASLGAIGAAGIPGGSIVFIPIVLGVAGVPVEVIAIVLAVDRIMDMMRTVANVVGDSVAGLAVAKWEGELDEEHYRRNGPAVGLTAAP